MTDSNTTDFSAHIKKTQSLRDSALLRTQEHQLDIIDSLSKLPIPLTVQQQHQLSTAQETYKRLLKKDQDQHE